MEVWAKRKDELDKEGGLISSGFIMFWQRQLILSVTRGFLRRDCCSCGHSTPRWLHFSWIASTPTQMKLKTLGSGAEPRVTEGDEHQEHRSRHASLHRIIQ